MRITVDIPDSQYELLQVRAKTQERSVQELLLQGVESVLREEAGPQERRLKLPLIRSEKPGSLDMDNQRIYDLIGVP